MTYIVVPLSRAGGGRGPIDPVWVSLSVLVHAAGIGIPVALAARAALQGRAAPSEPAVASGSTAQA